ncbi:MAG: energy transducer TonB [Crocinitomicaceae bacterium]|nr:energy transducer TonB [Crocinitomicaceae bacterium]
MIAKKNPKVDVEKKRAAIFNVGLLVAGSFTLAAFTYSEPTLSEKEKLVVNVDDMVVFEMEKPKDEPVKEEVQQPQQQEQEQQEPQNLGSETGISEVMKASDNGKTGPKVADGPGVFGVEIPFVKPNLSSEDEIVIPKIDAKYVGGVLEMRQKIADVQEYPDIDIQLGVQGTVYVSFVVEKDGSVTNVITERGVSETLDREAVRIVKTFPKWIPGEDEYGVVRTRVRMPIKFLLH